MDDVETALIATSPKLQCYPKASSQNAVNSTKSVKKSNKGPLHFVSTFAAKFKWAVPLIMVGWLWRFNSRVLIVDEYFIELIQNCKKLGSLRYICEWCVWHWNEWHNHNIMDTDAKYWLHLLSTKHRHDLAIWRSLKSQQQGFLVNLCTRELVRQGHYLFCWLGHHVKWKRKAPSVCCAPREFWCPVKGLFLQQDLISLTILSWNADHL